MKLTLFLIAANVLLFLQTSSNPDYYLERYGFSMNSFLEGRYYTLLTASFIHFDIWHLIANMAALLVFGGAVESKAGSFKYIMVYALAGVTGVLSAFVPIFNYSQDTVFMGASAAISGLIGFAIFINPGSLVFFPSIIPIPIIVASAIYLLTTATILFDKSGIAYPAHLFGLLTGLVFGMLFGKERIKRLILFIVVIVLISMLPLILGYVWG